MFAASRRNLINNTRDFMILARRRRFFKGIWEEIFDFPLKIRGILVFSSQISSKFPPPAGQNLKISYASSLSRIFLPGPRIFLNFRDYQEQKKTLQFTDYTKCLLCSSFPESNQAPRDGCDRTQSGVSAPR